MTVTASTATPEAYLERICSENLAVYRESQARLQEDVSQESQVAHDYRGRRVYELLQNADDALVGVTTTGDRALFRLTDNELWVANTGRAFTEADVRGLCGLGASSKAQSDGPKRASIGHKGLGFKSVLEITAAAEAYSETVSFRLGREHAYERVGALWDALDRGNVRGVPAMRFPSAIPEANLPCPVRGSVTGHRAVTGHRCSYGNAGSKPLAPMPSSDAFGHRSPYGGARDRSESTRLGAQTSAPPRNDR